MHTCLVNSKQVRYINALVLFIYRPVIIDKLVLQLCKTKRHTMVTLRTMYEQHILRSSEGIIEEIASSADRHKTLS